MSQLSVGLTLTDRLSGPAASQAAAMGKVTSQILKADAALKGLDKHAGDVSKSTAKAGKDAASSATGLERFFGKFKSPTMQSALARTWNAIGTTFGPKATGLIAGFANKFGSVNDLLGDFGTSIGGVAKAGFGALALGAVAAVTAIAAVVAALAAVGVGLVAIGAKGAMAFTEMALKTGMAREDSLVALTAMLKSEASAKKVYNQAIKLAAETPFETQDVISSFQQLLGGGFAVDELDGLVRSLSDLAAIKGAAALPAATEALIKLRGQGKLTEEVLERLQTAGLGKLQIAKAAGVDISKLSGMKGPEAEAAILKAIADNFGGAAKAKSEALSGLLSTITSRPFELFNQALEGGGLAGFYKSVKAAADWVSKTFDAESPTGKRIVGLINMIGDSWAKLAGGVSLDTMTASLNSVLTLAERFLPVVLAFVEGFGAGFMRGLEPLGALFRELAGMDSSKATTMADAFRVLGHVLGVVASGVVFVFGFVLAIGVAIASAGSFAKELGGAFDSAAGSVSNVNARVQSLIGAMSSLAAMNPLAGLGSAGLASVGAPAAPLSGFGVGGVPVTPGPSSAPTPGNGPSASNQNNNFAVTVSGIGLDESQLAARIRAEAEALFKSLLAGAA